MQTRGDHAEPLESHLAALVSLPPVGFPFLLHGPPQGCAGLLDQFRTDLWEMSAPHSGPGRSEFTGFGHKDLGRGAPCFASKRGCPQDLVGANSRDVWPRGFQNQVTKSENERAGDARGQTIPRGPLA